MLTLSEDGYVFWSQGAVWFSHTQFTVNVLMATNLPLGSNTTLVQETGDTLSNILDLQVLCECVDGGDPMCVGGCLQRGLRAVGISLTMGRGGGVEVHNLPQFYRIFSVMLLFKFFIFP